ncbi:hypothetical protein LHGZ1_1609 [Laribacter hongkongensis]|uniref:Uncharacterized protein n=1 Tax=Laribacter hongkongensis TaxID=168471 RepID=A0A248LI23_9NEIS|nr:hypothetical protein LHGZ1_1609 [Laribacter hongkongensis]
MLWPKAAWHLLMPTLSSKFDAMNDERIDGACTSGMHRHGRRGALLAWRAFHAG